MKLNPEPLPITADDEAIRAAVAVASPVPLLAALAQITGDPSLLRDDLRPDPSQILDPNGGLDENQIAQSRALAVAALIRFRDGGSVRVALPEGPTLERLLTWVAGGALEPAYVPLLEEELALGGDRRAPAWHKRELAPDADFKVAIIGSGMSGLAVAHRLHQAGVEFTIFEKNADVGGTWFDNVYPGCRVDIANHFYSYSFAQTNDWSSFYSPQGVLLDYFRACARDFGLREHIRFSTEVQGATWDEARGLWVLRLRDSTGRETTAEANALVSAVGQLNRPKMPAIPGIDRFRGESFHSARWRHDVELGGRRVGIIGTGASAAQFIPPVAEVAAHLTVFQRTPPWLLSIPNYMDELPEALRGLLRCVPEYGRWDRLQVFWRTHEGLLPAAVVDPSWPHQERSVSALNDGMRQLMGAYYDAAFPDPELRARVLPRYPPISKRIVLDNGVYPRTLARENLTLVTDSIAEITETGVRTQDGVLHEFDVLIYGTGFEASKFLMPMQIKGEGGVDLHERWGGDARAHLGIVVPVFPNLFLMYGPNTNIVINGSIIYFSECEANYIVESVRLLLERRKGSMTCRADVHDAYNRRIDAGNRAMAWGAATVNTWYRNEFGRIAQNWPFSLLEYWQQTRAPDPADYVLR